MSPALPYRIITPANKKPDAKAQGAPLVVLARPSTDVSTAPEAHRASAAPSGS